MSGKKEASVFKRAIKFVLLAPVLAWMYPSNIACISPLIVLMYVFDSAVTPVYKLLNAVVVSLILFCNVYIVCGILFHMVLGLVPLSVIGLLAYSPLFVIYGSNGQRYGTLKTAFVYLMWDPPLLAMIWLSSIFGGRFLPPLISPICEGGIMGSIPMARDVKILEENNVGAVINMCMEYSGPIAGYRRADITQLHLPTTDTTSPSKENLMKGVQFLKDFRKNSPDKNFFIHCKGGRGRAATMMCAWLMSVEGHSLKSAVTHMKKQRSVVSTAILKYDVLHEIERELSVNKKKKK